MKVFLTETDGIRPKMYSREETIALFGEDFFEDYAINIPIDVANRYFTAEKQFMESLDEIAKFKKGN